MDNIVDTRFCLRVIMRVGLLKRSHVLALPARKYLATATASAKITSNGAMSLPTGFKVESVKEVPEYDMTLYSIEHERTGAKFFHFNRDDKNSAFCVQFRTVPNDSTGVAHILEHLVLCGSKNFPCPEPFFKMLTRSMATFLNAMTGPDLTMYPFSTQNQKDFENLLRIYLDAAFFPNLEYLDFRQEGWRLDTKKSADENTSAVAYREKGSENIEFAGVVFNEMKGAMSQLPSMVDHLVRSNLLPSNTYSNNFGGEPLSIINLTHDQLKNFHATYYHPSNAKFVLYGDFPIERWLKLIDELVLKNFEKLEIDSQIQSESKWTAAKTKVEYFQQPQFDKNKPQEVEIAKRQSVVTSAFLIGHINEPYNVYCWNILSYLLTSGPASPFHKSLIQSGLGANFSPVTGFESDVKDCYFSIGAQNVDNENPDAIVEAIDATIEKTIEEGFDQQRIDSVLHLIELDLKHQSSNFGLKLLMGSASKLNHDCDLQEFYSLSQIFDRLRYDLKNDPNFLQEMVKNSLKNNPHRLNLVMKPKEEFFAGLQTKEDLALNERLYKLDQAGKNQILSESVALLEKQTLIPDASSLPKLLISDLETKIETYPSEIVEKDNLPSTQVNVQPTNGICYFKSVFSTEKLTAEERRFLPMFCSVLTKLGAENLNFEQLRSEIDLCSGGFSVTTSVTPHPKDLKYFEESIVISSYALLRNVDKMFALWNRILTAPDFEATEYLKVILKQRSEMLQMSMEQSGHRYAMRSSAATLNAVCAYDEIYSGMSQIALSRQVALNMEIEKYVSLFKSILKKIFTKENARCALNLPESSQTECLNALGSLFSNLNSVSEVRSSASPFWIPAPEIPEIVQKRERLVKYLFPFQVSYAGRSLAGVPYGHSHFAPLEVLSKLLSWNYLHKEIREKGGAYGGGATNNSSGVFTFFSYRDPTPYLSQRTFQRSLDWLQSASVDQEMIDGAKLTVFQSVDSPVAPGSRNVSNFFSGITEEMRQERRDRLFACTKLDVIEVAETYLSERNLKMSGGTVIGPKNEDSNKLDWPVVTE